MNRLMVCPTCDGEGRIEDRREHNRDEEEALEPSLLDAKAYPNLNGLFGRKEEEVVEPIPSPRPEHCNTHNRYKKSCKACREIVA